MMNQAIQKLTYGLYVLTVRVDGRDNGCIIDTVAQVSYKSTQICISKLHIHNDREDASISYFK